MLTTTRLFILLFIFSLTACVSIPTGPSVLTLPGSGINFEQFRFDEQSCRQYAYEQVGGETPNKASMSSGAKSAATGSTAGVTLGGREGAGTGLLAGGLMGSSNASTSGYVAQQRYDHSYIQCMYAKGHRVPVSGKVTSGQGYSNSDKGRNISNPPSGFTPPPPPLGNPPPPPKP